MVAAAVIGASVADIFYLMLLAIISCNTTQDKEVQMSQSFSSKENTPMLSHSEGLPAALINIPWLHVLAPP
ncbi:hypothetical protein DVA76_19415 [Acinetobacter baumannii]|nr:hypothetical protein DVA76_19415 [Acinetobacter baumannii]